MFGFRIRKRNTHSENMRAMWRKLNTHNTTELTWIPRTEDFFKVVTVGKKTYGEIYAIYSGNVSERLTIGNYCSIGSGTIFMLGSEHPYKTISTFPFKVKSAGYKYEATTKGPIRLQDDVWIGERVLILSGVSIGQGAVVAAGSIVVKNVPPYAIVAGNPAKVIKYRFSDTVIEKLVTIDWSRVREESVGSNLELLYQEINDDNVDSVLSRFNERLIS